MSLYKIGTPGISCIILLQFALLCCFDANAQMSVSDIKSGTGSNFDSLSDNQVLYNGQIWINQYYQVADDQFLFFKDFLPGRITMRGRTFSNVMLKYDLFKDEILTPSKEGILQINKEMIDSFSLSFINKSYDFVKIGEDSLKKSSTFFNVLYNGKTPLLIKYSKKIDKLAVEGKYDKFYQITKVFLYKGNKLFQVTGKSDLFDIMSEYKTQIKEFMKTNKISVSVKDPESFIPVIKFYDTLNL